MVSKKINKTLVRRLTGFSTANSQTGKIENKLTIKSNKMKKNLQKSIVIAITSILFVVACNKKSTTTEPVTTNPKDFTSFEYSGIFSGSLSSSGSSSPIEGYVTIDSEGEITLDLLSGRMTGNALKTSTNYNISISQTTGIFQDVINITGTIEIVSRTLYLSGDAPDGSPVTLGGTTPEVLTTGGWEKLSKSAVYFTHNESCKASITINGITLNGLNNHYATGGLCSPTYALSNTIRSNHENKQSKVFCHDIKLKGLNGQPISITDCNTAAFYLPKNTPYKYTVKWENGQTTTGSFTSPDGGGQLPICISNDGPECNHSLSGKWLDPDGTGIQFSGTKATFYSFSTNWELFLNNGTVSVGSSKVRNVSQVNATKWNCETLFLKIVDGKPISVAWSTDGTITMNASGSTITITATSPFGGIGSATYTRVL